MIFLWFSYMGVSKNRGTPKWMVSNGKPYWNWWFGGTTIFGNIHMDTPESPQFEPDNPRKNLFRKKKTWQDLFVFFTWSSWKGPGISFSRSGPAIYLASRFPVGGLSLGWAVLNHQEVINEVFPWTPKPKTMKKMMVLTPQQKGYYHQ